MPCILTNTGAEWAVCHRDKADTMEVGPSSGLPMPQDPEEHTDLEGSETKPVLRLEGDDTTRAAKSAVNAADPEVGGGPEGHHPQVRATG